MKNCKMRKLDKNALKEVLEEANLDFIKDLPCSPEEIFEFATRRVEPEISENISYNLGRRMLEHRLSDKDYFMTLLMIIHDIFNGKEQVLGTPQAQILFSQTGAGKTNLRKKLLKENPNSVIINSDLYKKFRPDADKIMEEDPTHFGALTGIDCYDHASNIMDFATKMKYNILTECAPSSTGKLIGVNMQKINEENYDAQFHIMAVGDIVSALAIHFRYEIDLINKEPGAKLTDLKRHDESYQGAAEAIKALIPDNINIYRRGNKNEGEMPINISEGEPNKNIVTLLQIFKREREKSNYEYYKSGKLKADYETIQNLMEDRNAPGEQRKQLREIYDKCILRREEFKFLKNAQGQSEFYVK